MQTKLRTREEAFGKEFLSAPICLGIARQQPPKVFNKSPLKLKLAACPATQSHISEQLGLFAVQAKHEGLLLRKANSSERGKSGRHLCLTTRCLEVRLVRFLKLLGWDNHTGLSNNLSARAGDWNADGIDSDGDDDDDAIDSPLPMGGWGGGFGVI